MQSQKNFHYILCQWNQHWLFLEVPFSAYSSRKLSPDPFQWIFVYYSYVNQLQTRYQYNIFHECYQMCKKLCAWYLAPTPAGLEVVLVNGGMGAALIELFTKKQVRLRFFILFLGANLVHMVRTNSVGLRWSRITDCWKCERWRVRDKNHAVHLLLQADFSFFSFDVGHHASVYFNLCTALEGEQFDHFFFVWFVILFNNCHVLQLKAEIVAIHRWMRNGLDDDG